MNDKRYKILITCTMLIRILIQIGIPLYMIPSAQNDDMLFTNYAKSILETGWLGEYNHLTLNKVPGFSLFLALLKELNIPYMLGIALFYCFAAYLFLIAIQKFITQKGISYLLFVFVLFSPVMYDVQIAQRIYRMSVIPGAILAVVSCYLCVFFERKNGWRNIIGWCVGAGVNLAFFYIIREDAIWFSCFIFGATVLMLSIIVFEYTKDKDYKKSIFKVICLFVPILISLIGVNVIKLINYNEYGIYATNDFSTTSYADMGKAILKIDPEEEIEHVWITSSMIEKAYEVSPTFATIKDYLNKQYKELDSWGYGVLDGEIEKDYLIWAIRWAASDSGLYQDAVTTDEFYKKVALEINQAFKENLLKKREVIVLSHLARPINLKRDITGILSHLTTTALKIANYQMLNCTLGAAVENNSNIDIMSSITSTIPSYNGEEYRLCTISGWIFAENNEVKLQMKLCNSDGEYKEISFTSSKDVYLHYNEKGEEYTNAEKCRFSFTLPESDTKKTRIEIYMDNQMVYSMLLNEFSGFSVQGTKSCIDKNVVTNSSKIYYSIFNKDDVELSNGIIKFYRITGKYIGGMAILLYFFQLVFNIYFVFKKGKVDFSVWLVETGLLLTILTNITIVSINYFDAYNREGATSLYLAGVYPIWQIFICLTVCDAYSKFAAWRKNRIRGKVKEQLV